MAEPNADEQDGPTADQGSPPPIGPGAVHEPVLRMSALHDKLQVGFYTDEPKW